MTRDPVPFETSDRDRYHGIEKMTRNCDVFKRTNNPTPNNSCPSPETREHEKIREKRTYKFINPTTVKGKEWEYCLWNINSFPPTISIIYRVGTFSKSTICLWIKPRELANWVLLRGISFTYKLTLISFVTPLFGGISDTLQFV